MSERRTYRLSGGMFDREEGTSEVKRLFFLSVEGSRSEPSYFHHLNRSLRSLGARNAVIEVLKHPNDGLTSPQDVFNLLEECRDLREGGNILPVPVRAELESEFSEEDIRLLIEGKCQQEAKVRRFSDILLNLGVNIAYRKYLKRQPSDGDWFAIVIDRDCQSHARDAIKEIQNKCEERNFLFCLTNPCFEFWLLMHLAEMDKFTSPDELRKIAANARVSKAHTHVSKIVSTIAGHAKRIPMQKFTKFYSPNLIKAMNESLKFATTEDDVVDNPGTTMPKLIREVLGIEANLGQ